MTSGEGTTGVPTLDQLELEGRRVLVRVDFNVPLDGEGRITDDTRIRAALPTLRAVLERGGRPVLLCHLGRPRGEPVESLRLDPVARRLGELLGTPVQKLDGCVGEEVARAVQEAPAGVTVLLENVRFEPGETRGDEALAKAYAALGDVFVNDAFGASHRDHASVSGIARLLPSAAGLLLERELEAFARVLRDPARPLLAVLGGAKVSDKLPVIRHLVGRVDALLVGGGMAYTFLAAQGHAVGTSLLEPDLVPLCAQTLAQAKGGAGADLVLPTDHVLAQSLETGSPTRESGIDIPEGWMGLDIGPRTSERFAARIRDAATVVWNGPMGVFEDPRFRAGTEAVGRALGEAHAYTVVGGGDSVAAIHLLGLERSVSHISTGGGASLELLQGRVLPGIAALGRPQQSSQR
ncbi:MAG: phosphoglycerate kinase [Proteobacteria bacterium]|nr:phosphoglycerate kinase [Pseudomonadota bacterium]